MHSGGSRCPTSDTPGSLEWWWCRWHQPVPGHDSDKLRAIGRPAGAYDCSNITKILSAYVRRQDDQCAGRVIVRVTEVMNRPTRGKHPFARHQVAHYPVDRVPKLALQHIDALFVMRVAMWRRDLSAGRDSQFENAHPARGGSVDQILNAQLTNMDGFDRSRADTSNVGEG